MKYLTNIIALCVLQTICLQSWATFNDDIVEIDVPSYSDRNLFDAECNRVGHSDLKEIEIAGSLIEKALCLYHTSDPGNEQKSKQIVDVLHSASQRGLTPAKRSAAALFEGLSQCRMAKDLLELYLSDRDNYENQRRFCDVRTKGRDAFAAVDWRITDIRYGENSLSHSIDDLIDTYQECYSTALGDNYSSECNAITSIAWEKIKKIIDKKIEDQIDKNFKGETAPMSAMFMRKFGMIKGQTENITKAKQSLEEKIGPFKDNVDDLEKLFYDEALKTKRVKIVDNYKNFIIKGNVILMAIDHIYKGLLVRTSDGEDLGLRLDERKEEIDDAVEQIDKNDSNVIGSLSETLSGYIKAKRNIQSVQNQFCKIYYCHLLGRANLTVTKIVSEDFQYYDNPLRIKLDGTYADGYLTIVENDIPVKYSVEEICKNAGLEDEYRIVNMSPRQSRQCLNDFRFDQ